MTSSPPPQSMLDNSPQQRTASRIIVSVRRSITPASKRHARSRSMQMYSTPQEISPPPAPAFREESSASARPTIEQIAMGLHVSRTPHLHSSSRRPHSRSTSHPSPSPSLPPLRSSLKKTTFVSSASTSESSAVHTLPLPTSPSASSSTITSSSMHISSTTANHMGLSSVSPRLQQGGSASSALTALKLRMAKLLPGERRRSASSSMSMTATETGQEKKITTRKAVRFES